jgi:hypothetical protein
MGTNSVVADIPDGQPITLGSIVLGSIVEESIEECEVVHTSNKKFI